MKERRTQFKVVALEDVFKTAIEVDGIGVPDETMQRKQERAQLRRCRERSSKPEERKSREATQNATSDRNPLH